MYQDDNAMNQSAKAEESDEKEASWVANYVSKGGSADEGRKLYQKMLASKNTTTSVVPDVANTLRNVAESIPSKEADLFGDTPAPAPPKEKKAVAKRPQGRPSVDWSKREKSKTESDLFQLSLEIEKTPAHESKNQGFLATAMIYASLPHSKIEGTVFKRKSGKLNLTIMNDPEIGLPYGKVPRIITAFLCTEAKLKNSPEIELGKSLSEFAKKLGMGVSGGERGGITRLKDQAHRLFTSHISLVGKADDQFQWRNVNIAESGMLLWNPLEPGQESQWSSKLTLGDKFFEECIQHSVPIDMRILHKLRSPLAIDIYIWLTYRYNSIDKPTRISWEQLMWQFGSNYAGTEQGLKNFITNFNIQLRAVKAAYPEANYTVDRHTLSLLPSRPHIAPKK